MRTDQIRTFSMNGQTFVTDKETLAVLRKIIPSARKACDPSAVVAMISLGLKTGRIRYSEKDPSGDVIAHWAGRGRVYVEQINTLAETALVRFDPADGTRSALQNAPLSEIVWDYSNGWRPLQSPADDRKDGAR